ncbi:MAG: VanZ family protein [Bacteroidetes bacterium]|nr:VanZ family protein [Bacteroidota bacterium]
MSTRVSSRRTVLPAFLWFLLIMVLLSLPGDSFGTFRFEYRDKLGHFVLFGVQQFLLWIALELPHPRYASHRRSLLISSLATLVFGALSELYQGAFTSRMADPFDMLANGIGVAAAVLAIRLFTPERVLKSARVLYRLKHT